MSNKPFPVNPHRRPSVFVCVLALVAGCTGAEPPVEGAAGGAGGEVVSLVPTLALTVTGDSVWFTFRVANNGTDEVALQFASGKRFDFVVLDGAGGEVWRWSADRMFTQVLGEERLEAGGVLEYGASWDPGDLEGSYRAVARLESSDRPLELGTEFELGG